MMHTTKKEAYLITGGKENLDPMEILVHRHKEPILSGAPDRARDMVINGNRKYKGKYN